MASERRANAGESGEWTACPGCNAGHWSFRERHWQAIGTEEEMVNHLRQQLPSNKETEELIERQVAYYRFRHVWKDLESERGKCKRHPGDLMRLFEKELRKRRGA